ncbi:MAG: coenzyme F420-0:L-glutamate ligase [Nocardioidaceae bacterium]
MSTEVTAWPLLGFPEVEPGCDLAALVAAAADLLDGDVVVVTSKVVSKAEGLRVDGDRDLVIDAETVRVVARRGPTTIARTRHGLTLAAAGVDASNTEPGTVLVLPRDPDATARELRHALATRTGHNVAVLLSDTAGRPWRDGQTDIAIGAAGLLPLVELAGRTDSHGTTLAVTAPAVADEIAGLADLVMGKTDGRPVAVVRGLADLVLPPDEDGPGATALVRPDAGDMFGLGSREAVLAAVRRDDPQSLAALRRDEVGIDELLELAGSTTLTVEALDDGGFAVGGEPDLVTAAALERVVITAATTTWRVLRDDRNSGAGRIVVSTSGDIP